MNEQGQIEYIRHDEIDFQKWDLCIGNSINVLPYAFSWYLDRIAITWDALVMGDYLYVMPLPTGKKWGIYYLLQPIFLQQLGIFSPFEISPEVVSMFLMQIPSKFRLISLNLNSFNRYYPGLYTIKRNSNYQLDLTKPYKEIHEGYSENTKRNIKKATGNGLQVFQIHDTSEFIGFLRNFLQGKTNVIKREHFERLRSLIHFTITHGIGKIYGVYSGTNTLCAAAFFLQSCSKHFYLAAASNQEGIDLRGMFLIVDHYIRNHAESLEILDFEGSNIEGIARFYAGFGAKPFYYETVSLNRLPWPLRLIKK